VHHFAGYGLMADVARRPALAARMYARAEAAAAALGDPVLVGYVAWKRGAGAHLAGSDEAETWIRALTEHERWLDLGDYLTGVSCVCIQLFKRGRTHEAYAWYARGTARLGPGAQAEGAAIGAAAAVIAAQRGRRDEAMAALDSMSRFLEANPDNRMQLINLLAARVIVLVELGELGEAFERGTGEFAALGIRPRDLVPEQRVYYIYQALGRLAQCRTAGREHWAASLRAAEQAVAMLGQAANNRVLRAFHAAARADLELLAGRPLDALHKAVPAELGLMPLDAPLISYELARVRARALRALGEAGQAQVHARYALLLAIDQQWDLRARSIRAEFGISGVGPLHSTGTPLVTTVTDTPPVSQSPSARNGGGREVRANPSNNGAALSRRLAALQQVSLAAATVLDPRELARVALDETVRILGAERAYLFLVDPDLDQLVPHLGRDGDGNDIDELTGYSSTLVERVRQTGEALVVTGSEEGVALGSRSAQVHGLRSIMIAPLLFDGRMRGVVYLDSRVAKGMFTSDDVDILTAVTNHVAVSLETARAAQLAAAVQAARRERDVAETLRAAMAEQSATLDPDEVMRRLLGALCRTLTADAAVLLSSAGDRLVVTAAHGVAVAVGTDLAPVPPLLADLPGPRVGTVSEGQSPPFGALLGPARCWLALPATERGAPLGVLLVASNRPDAMSEGQVEIAAALAGQGMTAYQNAQLFSQVRRLATIDGLTGLHNRRHFFAEATGQFRVARRYGRPIAAIMIDVDYFKRINDAYGHPVGDEVIRVLAHRLRATLRDGDVLGRYGGEEFALLTPETGPAAEQLAERLRQVVSAEPVPTPVGPLPVTISLGVAYLREADVDLDQLVARADAALYEAKQNGRNRIAVA
jgi:diguanylate cyclase (GGDEF)-like protein